MIRAAQHHPPSTTACALSTRAHGSLGPATLPSCAALRARSEQGCLCEPVGLGRGPTRLVETRPAACALHSSSSALLRHSPRCTPSDRSPPPCLAGHQHCRRRRCRRGPSGRYRCLNLLTSLPTPAAANMTTSFLPVWRMSTLRSARHTAGSGVPCGLADFFTSRARRALFVAQRCPVTPTADEGEWV
jgi:hypothetical protein